MKRFKKYNKIDKHATLDQEEYTFTELLNLVREKTFDSQEEPNGFDSQEVICNHCGHQGDFYYTEPVVQYGHFSYIDKYGEIHNPDQTDTDYTGEMTIFCGACSRDIDVSASFEKTLEQWRIQYAKVVKAFSV